MALEVAAQGWQRATAKPEAIMGMLDISSRSIDVGAAFGVVEDARVAAAFRAHGVPRDEVDELRSRWRYIMLGGWARLWRARHPPEHPAHAQLSRARQLCMLVRR